MTVDVNASGESKTEYEEIFTELDVRKVIQGAVGAIYYLTEASVDGLCPEEECQDDDGAARRLRHHHEREKI